MASRHKTQQRTEPQTKHQSKQPSKQQAAEGLEPAASGNVVILHGVLSSPPRSRELPSGSVLWSWEVTTRDLQGAAQTVPVVAFDPPKLAHKLEAGDHVVVAGQVRRRFFRAGGATVSRTEVVASGIANVRRTASVRRIVASAEASVAALAANLAS